MYKYNLNNQPQSIYNNSLTNTPQIENNYNNQTNIMQTRTVPPTPPPDSSSRCMTPSNIKPGKKKMKYYTYSLFILIFYILVS